MDAVFSLRIVTVDYFMSKPCPGLDDLRSKFKSAIISRVPIVRVFGSTPAGEYLEV